MTVALQVKNLRKTFPGVVALADANITVEAGSIHALMGENGAGKSTLIKIVTGVQPADQGAMLLHGTSVSFSNPLESMDAGIGVVHQERNVVRDFTVGENIALSAMPRRAGRIDWPAVWREARRCLEMLDLDLDPRTPMRDLSAAQTQLVEIARGLYRRATVLLLDEPTASLSNDEADRLYTVVHQLAEQGTAIVLVSHKLDEVFAHCDAITVLRDGSTVMESRPIADTSREEVVSTMVGRTLGAMEVEVRTVDRTGTPALELRDVSTSAGHRAISLSVHPGEIVGMYGLVGAGRTELARSILGLERVTAGETLVDGTAVRIRSVRDALQRFRMGYVTENRKEEGVFLLQSITRNIAVTVWTELSRFLGRVPYKRERDTVTEFVEALEIKISTQDQLAGQLSGGNQQKVSLAKWLAAKTRILIIDEPTVGIDVKTKRAFYELIWKLADEGLAILLISSDLAEMVTLADRIIVMDRFTVRGEVDNTHDYDTMSTAVIHRIHRSETAA
ncbi:sugar ABC transporter ATP-binding protein [Microbacterium rhizosphaerae]|uniref:Sugar ABC transporter ATP-binding protein n=1 Tax=Microbacterium rhizosphaerae TaxID=1678237 RepID=A0ABZ0SQP3_9MICO|nr:sugar ABC transporter ATP-binding protein [Microbacterium rhizosphaerae]WPR90621.1 sugar ABC transporter ATP-binding protein [Microbacterium rhizosphaerae]